jgi:hypothetical protein
VYSWICVPVEYLTTNRISIQLQYSVEIVWILPAKREQLTEFIQKLNTAAGGELTDAPADARDERDEGEPTRRTPCVHPQADSTFPGSW